jgi:peptidoglycan/xylan/chitin deacetylase (PgdA/CDA1 family)
MRFWGLGFAAGCLLASCIGSSPAEAGGVQQNTKQFAYFQATNIFHAGLRGTHTVSLTFDDGPNQYTPAVLAALKSYGIQATFFIVGRMAVAHPNVLAEIASEGHLLANHSASHPALRREVYRAHPELLIEQIRAVNNLIAPLMQPGDRMFFRAPYGSWRAPHAAVLNADPVLKYYVGPIYWDEGGGTYVDKSGYVITSADWDCWHRGWKAETCAKGYLREIERKDGGVVLMHCIHRQSADLVNAVVPALIKQGYKFVRLDRVPEFDQYQTPSAPAAPMVAMREPVSK